MSLDREILASGKSLSKKFYARSPFGNAAAITDIFRETFFLKPAARRDEHAFTWVLRNVSFEIHRGESILLSGAPKTGKTPILNLICGLYKPDEGALEVNGQSAILSSNATFFHPCRSIRQNIFLTAGLFGFSKNQTRARLGSILELSGLLPPDSSTMGLLSHHEIWMRLAVAIFLHAELDLYLLDETLLGWESEYLARVGRKMEEIKQRGGSVLAITHEPQNLKKYFNRILRLEGGVLTQVSA